MAAHFLPGRWTGSTGRRSMRAWSGRNGSGPQSGVPWTWPGNNGPDRERGRGFRRVRRNDWTWERVRTAAASTDGWKRTRRGEWRGPCQCGGERDRAWVRRGRGAVVAGCNAGCDGVDVLRWLIPDPVRPGFRRMRGASPPRRDDTPRPRPDTHPEAPRPVQARTTPLPGRGPSKPPNPAPPAETEAVGSPRSAERHPPQGRGKPGFVPPKPNHAAVLWADSRPVPLDTAHPARLWAARRHLWPPGEPFPEAVRWLPHPDGGSLVACFAPVPDWRAAHPPNPSGVQLVHVDRSGAPRPDAGRLAKRSHGSMSGAVAVIGAPLWRAGCVHVAEGLADALAIAAREGGAALAAGGTAGFPRLADVLGTLSTPVTIWPDGDGPGRIAATKLLATLTRRGAVAALASIPDGHDPASLAGPSNTWRIP